MPQPDSAMFYFKTNKLGFDAEFFGRVKLVAALADLAGMCCWVHSGFKLYFKYFKLYFKL
jgi:hypothetical protein